VMQGCMSSRGEATPIILMSEERSEPKNLAIACDQEFSRTRGDEPNWFKRLEITRRRFPEPFFASALTDSFLLQHPR